MTVSLPQPTSTRQLGGVDSLERPTRVLVVDDHSLVRTGIASLIERDPAVKVVALAASGEEAMAAIESSSPDVVLLDYRLPGMSGAAACAEIVRRRPNTAVVMLTTYIDDDVIHACLVAGARGFLLKDITAIDLVDAVKAARRGEAVLAPEVTATIVRWARTSKALHERGQALTQEETDVLALVAEGLSNPVIARRLNMSLHVVKHTLRSIMGKLTAGSRSEAAAIAIRKGLI